MRFELRSLRSESRAITIYHYWSLHFIENNHANVYGLIQHYLLTISIWNMSGEAMLDWYRFRIMAVSELDI